jgi:tetratricopeptide (TPR) repeat protein
MFNEALEDANKAINLDMKWVKGHYRKGCALEALQKYQEAAQAFEKAYEICPSDVKLEQLIEEMKVKANAVQKHISNGIQPSRSNSNSSTPASITSNMSTRAFNGDILERSSGMSPGIASGLGINDGIRNHRSGSSSSSSIGRKSRFF